LYNKYYIDQVYDAMFVNRAKDLGTTLGAFDLGVIDGLGVDGAGWVARISSSLSIVWDEWIVDGLVNLAARIVWIFSYPVRMIQSGRVFGMLGLVVSLPLIWRFQIGTHGYQFRESYDWIPSIGAHYSLGIDGISFLLIMLTTILGAISILSSWSAIQTRKKEYYILFLLLQTAMLGVFMALDFFLFYLFWDVILVPLYFLIGVWCIDRLLYV